MMISLLLAHLGYLLIAQPQSSSTSTMSSLAKAAGIQYSQEYPCRVRHKLPTCLPVTHQPRYPCQFNITSPYHALSGASAVAGNAHSDVCELSIHELSKWVRSKRLYKQHVAPTPHNVALVVQLARAGGQGLMRVLLLTRDVAAAIHAACERSLHPDLGDDKRAGRRLDALPPPPPPPPPSPRPPPVIHPLSAEQSGTLEGAMQRWRQDWLRAAGAATDVFWAFTYEQMETRGRAAVLGEALKALGLPQNHAFVDADERLVNRSDAYCDRVMESLGR